MDMKTHCRQGHELTPENIYTRPDGYTNCRTCKNEQSKRYHAAHREKRAAIQWASEEKLREAVRDLYGRRCKRCGFDDLRALQLDHIIGGGREERKRAGRTLGAYRRALKFPNDYQLLCANCNWIKRAEEGEYGGYWQRRTKLDLTKRGEDGNLD